MREYKLELHIAALGVDDMHYRIGSREMVLVRMGYHTSIMLPFSYVQASEAMGFYGIPQAFFNNYEKWLRASGLRNRGWVK